jgi:hypothetical protein
MSIDNCFYSLIRFCPDPFRGERMNIGVVAIPRNAGKPLVKFTSDLKRVLRPWGGVSGYNVEVLRDDMRSTQISLESQLFDPQSFDKYRTKFGAILMFEQPQPTIFTSLEDTATYVLKALVEAEFVQCRVCHKLCPKGGPCKTCVLMPLVFKMVRCLEEREELDARVEALQKEIDEAKALP